MHKDAAAGMICSRLSWHTLQDHSAVVAAHENSQYIANDDAAAAMCGDICLFALLTPANAVVVINDDVTFTKGGMVVPVARRRR